MRRGLGGGSLVLLLTAGLVLAILSVSTGAKEKGITAGHAVGGVTTHTSKGLEAFNGREFDAAVTMGCGDACPLVRAKRRIDWHIPDPRDPGPDEFRQVRDLIGEKVKALLAELAS